MMELLWLVENYSAAIQLAWKMGINELAHSLRTVLDTDLVVQFV